MTDATNIRVAVVTRQGSSGNNSQFRTGPACRLLAPAPAQTWAQSHIS